MVATASFRRSSGNRLRGLEPPNVAAERSRRHVAADVSRRSDRTALVPRMGRFDPAMLTAIALPMSPPSPAAGSSRIWPDILGKPDSLWLIWLRFFRLNIGLFHKAMPPHIL